MVMEAELSLPSGSPTSPRRTPKLLGFQKGGNVCMFSKHPLETLVVQKIRLRWPKGRRVRM